MGLLVAIYALYAITLYFASRGGKVEEYMFIKTEKTNSWGDLLKLNFANFFLKGKGEMTTAIALKVAFFAILGTGVSCHFLVESCYHLADVFQISPYFTAVLLAAAATSVPDTVLSVRDALGGRVEDSLANALGSNVFDICIGLGLPALLYVSFVAPITFGGTLLNSLLTLEIALIMITSIALGLFLFAKNLKRFHAILLGMLFAGFIGIVIAQMYGFLI
ncbi:MAG: hypothetical protein JW812_03500 [Alphaproteobacteria bacterium]|nr:hypothetical protein [Alphaproteobacteria bacterium]MBN2779776.1 hypothetical protein [Alphaproteobacteria bacterium]